jgi:hypothetical protein
MPVTPSTTIEVWMRDALTLLSGTLTEQLQSVATHQVLIVDGWAASPTVRIAIARYLVGLRVCAIDAGLSIRAELTAGAKGPAEVVQNVNQIIGDAPGALDADAVARFRNPWIAEGLWHLCLVVAKQRAGCHPPGQVVAVNLPHPNPTDHGIDVAVLHTNAQGYGLSIIETKAYPDNVGAAIHRSTVFFREIDDGTHSVRLRQVMSVLRQHVPPIDQPRVSLLLWQERRTYIANAINWTNERPALAALFPGAQGVFVMPHEINGFGAFFEAIAEEMRRQAAIL